MALVPHKITALAESDADGTDGKNIVAGAVVSLFDSSGAAVTLFDDESGSNGSTSKQTDSSGQVVVWVTPGEYRESVNGSAQRAVTIGGRAITSYPNTESLQNSRPTQTGQRAENRDLNLSQYELAESGYTPNSGDIVAANGRVWRLIKALTGFGSLDELIQNNFDYGEGKVAKVIGEQAAEWKSTSTTGLTPNQSPIERDALELVDGSGRLWTLVSDRPNPKMLGSVSTGAELSQALNVALKSGCATLGGAKYVFSDEIAIATPNCKLYFDGGSIEQTTWGFSGLQVRADNVEIYNLDVNSTQSKVGLSTSLATRYEGNVSRARCSAVYAKQAANLKLFNPHWTGFVNGVYLFGFEYNVYRENQTGNALTSTTFELSPDDQQADDYYNGGRIRILSDNGATNDVTIDDYDSATNTVTFKYEQSTFSGPYYYYIQLGRTDGLLVDGMSGDKIDFAIVGAGYKNITVKGSRFKEIEQTQEVNARPHLVYLTNNNDDIAIYDNQVESCIEASAIKVRGATNIVCHDNIAYKSRGVVNIEHCENVTLNNNVSLEGGFERVGDVYGSFILNCKNIQEEGTRLDVDPSFAGGGLAANRPVGSNYLSDRTSMLEIDIGTEIDKIDMARISETKIKVGTSIDDHYAVLVSSTDSNQANSAQDVKIMEPVIICDNPSTNTKGARVISGNRVEVLFPEILGEANTTDIQFNSTVFNGKVRTYQDAGFTFTDGGSGATLYTV